MSESTDNISSRTANRAADLKQRVKRDGKQRIEKSKHAAADQIEDIADALDVAGARLDETQPTLANYASKLADGVGTFATRLREDSIEDLYRDARRFATEHPGMFLLGSAAVGIAIARFMKAETTDDANAAFDSGRAGPEQFDPEQFDSEQFDPGQSGSRQTGATQSGPGQFAAGQSESNRSGSTFAADAGIERSERFDGSAPGV
jgi:hypothetical protein